MKKKFVVMLSALMLMAVPALSLAAPTAGNNTVSSAAIIDGAVATADIANKAVTAAKIADATITANQLANGAVTAAKLGITCPSGQYLQYNGTTWVCSVGTAGPQGPQGVKGDTGLTGPQGPVGLTAKYANVIVVAKSGGDFTDPVAAANSISDASATNPYLIKVMPGVYDISQTVALNSYISLEGSGITSSVIRGTNIETTVSTVANNTISNIRIEGNSIALNVSSLGTWGEVFVNDVVLTAQGIALRADNLPLIGHNIRAYSSGDGLYFTNNSPQINNSIIVASGVGITIRNEYGYDGRLLPSPTFSEVVVEGSGGFYSYMCYNTPKIRNSQIKGTLFSIRTLSSYPGPYMTYVSNSELIGSTITERWSGYSSPAVNVCAGVTDSDGTFYPNTCPNAVSY